MPCVTYFAWILHVNLLYHIFSKQSCHLDELEARGFIRPNTSPLDCAFDRKEEWRQEIVY